MSCHGLGQERPGCPRRCFQRFLWRLCSHPSPREQFQAAVLRHTSKARGITLTDPEPTFHASPASELPKKSVFVYPPFLCLWIPLFHLVAPIFPVLLPAGTYRHLMRGARGEQQPSVKQQKLQWKRCGAYFSQSQRKDCIGAVHCSAFIKSFK